MKNIWISGSINSGKSTIAKLLGEKTGYAVIELDAFSEFLPNMPLEEKIPINLDIAIESVKVYNSRGIGTICVYPISSENFIYVKDRIADLYVFTLQTDLETALSNRGGRILSDKEKERVRHHHKVSINNPDFGGVIDTNSKTVAEVVSSIIKSKR